MMTRSRPHPLPVLLFAAALANAAVAQCALQWQAGDPLPFARGDVHATTQWDPDGAGPAPAVLVVGGLFGAGNELSTPIATWDGATWGALGAAPFPAVTALVVWNGQLVAAGGIGNQAGIAIWNGTVWSAIGATSTGHINTLAVFNGNLVVGGLFADINGAAISSIAQWNGASWSGLGGGVVGEVLATAVFGTLYVGGSMTMAGAVPVQHLAIWNGSAWAAGATFNAPVRTLAARTGLTTSSSFVFAGGDFTTVAGVPIDRIARFTASTGTWSALPGLPGASCRALLVRNQTSTTFQLYAAIEDPLVDNKVWRWSGTAWLTLGSVLDLTEPVPTALAFFNGQPVAAFAALHLAPSRLRVALRTHDGTSWQAIAGPGLDDRVHAALAVGDELVIGGEFTRYASAALLHIARGLPGNWQPLGGGLTGNSVNALCRLPNGDIVAGGDFAAAGGTPAANIARWDGSNWSPLGTGCNAPVRALLVLPNGDLIAGGFFSTAGGVPASRIARWNGTSWSAIGSGTDGGVLALARRSGGELLAAGSFLQAGGTSAPYIARWNGTAWSGLGSGLDGVATALAVLADDSVVVGGEFTTAGGIGSRAVALWNGTAWLAQSTPPTAWDTIVQALVALPDGSYIAGGTTSFFGLGGIFGGVDSSLARHLGGTTSLGWAAFDLLGPEVRAATLRPNGDLVVAGDFGGAGGLASHNVAVLRPSCPASAVAYGSGCVGSGGNEVLTAIELPWLGATFRARASGLPTFALALVVTGFAPIAVPMPAVLPQGVPGCTALVSPDLLDLVVPQTGVAATQVALPGTPALAGQTFRQQVVPLELDLAGNIVAVTGTNALTLTIGAL